MNPQNPPTTLKRPPPPKGANIFKKPWKTAPASCTSLIKPSEQCIKDMQAQPQAEGVIAFSGGELKLDKDHKCTDKQIGTFQTAAWDALTLGTYMSAEPNQLDYKTVALWKTWIGPDFPKFSKRITGMFSFFLAQIPICLQSSKIISAVSATLWERNNSMSMLHVGTQRSIAVSRKMARQ
jgi:hypothetical protein